MLLTPCDAEFVREAAPETPHLMDAGEEALQDERVARQNHHVRGIQIEIVVHLQLCHGHAPHEVLWNFHTAVHEAIVHRSAMLRLVSGLEPLDLVDALIDPNDVPPSTITRLLKRLPNARYKERKASNHFVFDIAPPFAMFVMESDVPSEMPAFIPNPNSSMWRAFCKGPSCFFALENVPRSQY